MINSAGNVSISGCSGDKTVWTFKIETSLFLKKNIKLHAMHNSL